MVTRRQRLLITCIFLASLAVSGLAKRLPPKPVAPVISAGVRYSAEGDGRDQYVVASDASSGKVLWRVKVFHTGIKFWEEEDVQWVFIADLKLADKFLFVRDEKSRCYSVDLTKGHVKRRQCGGGFVSSQTLPPAKIVTVDAFDVIGIKCRTNNASEGAGKGCIGQQWQRLMTEGLLQKIPGRVDNNIVAVYTDYASDKDGDYTYILGAKMKPGTAAPPEMLKTTVKAGRFAVFTSDKGPVQQVVVANWKRIWELPKSQPGGDRLYQSDFELYDERAADPKSAEMDIFIRIR